MTVFIMTPMQPTQTETINMIKLLSGKRAVFSVPLPEGAGLEEAERFFFAYVNLFQDVLLWMIEDETVINAHLVSLTVKGRLGFRVRHYSRFHPSGDISRFTASLNGDLHHLGAPSDWQLN
jgi:hypothetical protein